MHNFNFPADVSLSFISTLKTLIQEFSLGRHLHKRSILDPYLGRHQHRFRYATQSILLLQLRESALNHDAAAARQNYVHSWDIRWRRPKCCARM